MKVLVDQVDIYFSIAMGDAGHLCNVFNARVIKNSKSNNGFGQQLTYFTVKYIHQSLQIVLTTKCSCFKAAPRPRHIIGHINSVIKLSFVSVTVT